MIRELGEPGEDRQVAHPGWKFFLLLEVDSKAAEIDIKLIRGRASLTRPSTRGWCVRVSFAGRRSPPKGRGVGSSRRFVFEMQDVLLQRQSVTTQRQHAHPVLRHCNYNIDDILIPIANNAHHAKPLLTSSGSSFCTSAPRLFPLPVMS